MGDKEGTIVETEQGLTVILEIDKPCWGTQKTSIHKM